MRRFVHALSTEPVSLEISMREHTPSFPSANPVVAQLILVGRDEQSMINSRTEKIKDETLVSHTNNQF